MELFNMFVAQEAESGDGGIAGMIAGAMAALGAALAIPAILMIVIIIAMWKIFVKAGRPGWESIIPIYNTYILTCEIAKKPILFFILTLVPCVNIIAAIIILIEVAKKFGKSTGFGIGMVIVPFICIPMLGFGSAAYEGGDGGGEVEAAEEPAEEAEADEEE